MRHRRCIRGLSYAQAWKSYSVSVWPSLVGEDGFAFLRKSNGGCELREDGFGYICSHWEQIKVSMRSSPRRSIVHWTIGFDFRILTPTKQNSRYRKVSAVLWWGRTDSNHRSETQQIYSLSPLATRELPHIRFVLEPVDGLEPPTYWLQISCSTNWAIPAAQTEHAYYSTGFQKVKYFFSFFEVFFNFVAENEKIVNFVVDIL